MAGGTIVPKTIVIAGMSLAGLRAAESLRQSEYDGRIVAISAEHHLPYDRPPLSKGLLAGKEEPAEIALRKDGCDELALDWRLGARATALDVAARAVTLDTGEAAKKVLRLIDALEENDDVQDVYANFDIPDAILEGIDA